MDSTEKPAKRELLISGTGKPLVLLPGWAMNSAVWQPVQRQLESRRRIYRINLPGHGGRAYTLENASFDDWLADIMSIAPAKAVWLGWSMGGLFALAAAARYPERVQQLIMVASTPKFVSAADWTSAGESSVWQRFEKQLLDNPQAAEEQFLRTQALGSNKPLLVSKQLAELQRQGGQADNRALIDGLRILRTTDLRADIKQLTCSIHCLLSDSDHLVPVKVKDDIRLLNPACRIHVVASAGHALFVSQAGSFIEILNPILSIT